MAVKASKKPEINRPDAWGSSGNGCRIDGVLRRGLCETTRSRSCWTWQLKKGIITQEEYDEFMSATGVDSTVPAETKKKAEPATQTKSPENATAVVAPVPVGTEKKGRSRETGRLVRHCEQRPDTDQQRRWYSGGQDRQFSRSKYSVTIDLSIGYTSHSLVQSGNADFHRPYISGGVRYPRTTPTGPGGAQVPYPASNMSSQKGLFNSALSTSSWGIRATRDIGADGLKAFVVLDSAFNPATGQLTDQSHNESINSRYPTTAYATSSLNGQLFAKEAVGGFSGDKMGPHHAGAQTPTRSTMS